MPELKIIHNLLKEVRDEQKVISNKMPTLATKEEHNELKQSVSNFKTGLLTISIACTVLWNGVKFFFK